VRPSRRVHLQIAGLLGRGLALQELRDLRRGIAKRARLLVVVAE
jgi:hypothetical protein